MPPASRIVDYGASYATDCSSVHNGDENGTTHGGELNVSVNQVNQSGQSLSHNTSVENPDGVQSEESHHAAPEHQQAQTEGINHKVNGIRESHHEEHHTEGLLRHERMEERKEQREEIHQEAHEERRQEQQQERQHEEHNQRRREKLEALRQEDREDIYQEEREEREERRRGENEGRRDNAQMSA